MMYGIPDYRLPKEILDKEINAILSLGIKVNYGVYLGKDLSFDSLKTSGFKAILIAVGSQRSRSLNIPGEEITGDFIGPVASEAKTPSGVYDYPLMSGLAIRPPGWSEKSWLQGLERPSQEQENLRMSSPHWGSNRSRFTKILFTKKSLTKLKLKGINELNRRFKGGEWIWRVEQKAVEPRNLLKRQLRNQVRRRNRKIDDN